MMRVRPQVGLVPIHMVVVLFLLFLVVRNRESWMPESAVDPIEVVSEPPSSAAFEALLAWPVLPNAAKDVIGAILVHKNYIAFVFQFDPVRGARALKIDTSTEGGKSSADRWFLLVNGRMSNLKSLQNSLLAGWAPSMKKNVTPILETEILLNILFITSTQISFLDDVVSFLEARDAQFIERYGYLSWAAGQLEKEVAEGVYTPCNGVDIFKWSSTEIINVVRRNKETNDKTLADCRKLRTKLS